MVADLWFIDSLGLSTHHIYEAIRAYSATKAKDVQRVAKEHIRTDRLTIVVVGDASRIKEDLEKIAPVEVVRD